jgi:hypothetical protein
MAVQQITHKKIIKYDIKSPNFKATPKPEKEVDGNVVEEDVYGEKKHTYIPDSNGNLKMEELMGKIVNKLDNIPGGSQTGINAVEVDIKREIAIGKVDASAVKSEEYVGKVKNKKDKLKALRKRNGR